MDARRRLDRTDARERRLGAEARTTEGRSRGPHTSGRLADPEIGPVSEADYGNYSFTATKLGRDVG